MHENKNAYLEKTIIGMVKSSQFGKITNQAGRNKQAHIVRQPNKAGKPPMTRIRFN